MGENPKRWAQLRNDKNSRKAGKGIGSELNAKEIRNNNESIKMRWSAVYMRGGPWQISLSGG